MSNLFNIFKYHFTYYLINILLIYIDFISILNYVFIVFIYKGGVSYERREDKFLVFLHDIFIQDLQGGLPASEIHAESVQKMLILQSD